MSSKQGRPDSPTRAARPPTSTAPPTAARRTSSGRLSRSGSRKSVQRTPSDAAMPPSRIPTPSPTPPGSAAAAAAAAGARSSSAIPRARQKLDMSATPPVVPVRLDDDDDDSPPAARRASDPGNDSGSVFASGAAAGAGSGGGASSSADNVRVVCRFRPLNNKELREGSASNVTFYDNARSVDISSKDAFAETQTFHFDRVFGFDTTQAELYEHVAKPVVEGLFEGYNGTVFAYGQTSSGKTYTMQGPDIDSEDLRGIVPRIVHTVMDNIEKAPETIDFTLKISMVEIYMEKIRDLLDTTRDNLEIREHKDLGVYLDGCMEVFVTSPEIVYDVIRTGTENRATAATAMNEGSSRSHSVFIFTVVQKNLETLSSLTGKLYLVDLAGSEKIKKTNASGAVLEQAKKINWSLSALGNVINALTDGKSTHIPYRDSKLTRLLQESLGGNSRTALIMNCSPAESNREETVSTLRFGVRAKRMVNKPKVNKELSPTELRMLLELKEKEIVRLKVKIKSLEGKLAAGAGAGTGVAAAAATTAGDESAGSLEARLHAAEAAAVQLRERLEEQTAARQEIESQLEEMVSSFVTRVEVETRSQRAAFEAERKLLQQEVETLQQQAAAGDGLEDLHDEVKVLRENYNSASAEASKHRLDHDKLVMELRVLREAVGAVDLDGLVAEEGDDLDPAEQEAMAGGADEARGSAAAVAVDPSGYANEHAHHLATAFNDVFYTAASRAATAERSLASTRAALEVTEADAQTAAVELQSKAALWEGAQQRVAHLEAVLKDKDHKLLSQSRELQTTTEQLADAEENVTTLSSEFDTVKASLRAATSMMDSMSAQHDTAQDQVRSLKAELSELHSKYDVACRDRDRATESAATSKELLTSLQSIAKESSALDAQSQALKAELAATQASLRAARDSADASDQACKAARDEAAAQLSKAERTEEEKLELQRRVDSTEAARSDAVVRAVTAEGKAGELERLLRTKQSEVERLLADAKTEAMEKQHLEEQAAALPAKLQEAKDGVEAEWQQKLESVQEALETEWRARQYEWDRERVEIQAGWDDEREALQAEIVQSRKKMEEEYERAVASKTGTVAKDLQTAARSELKRLDEARAQLAAKNRELTRELTRVRRQRNMAMGEVNNRKLEMDILKSTMRALEMRLELAREDMHKASMQAPDAGPSSPLHKSPRAPGTPSARAGGAAGGAIVMHGDPVAGADVTDPEGVALKISALEDTVMHQMKQLQDQGNKMMDMEWREQKVLRDLRDRCAKVVDLQQALDSRDEQLKLLNGRSGKREKALTHANDVLRQSLAKSEDRAEALARAVSELSEQKQRLELKVARLSRASRTSSLGSSLAAGAAGAGAGAGGASSGAASGSGGDGLSITTERSARLVHSRHHTSLRGGGGTPTVPKPARSPSGKL